MSACGVSLFSGMGVGGGGGVLSLPAQEQCAWQKGEGGMHSYCSCWGLYPLLVFVPKLHHFLCYDIIQKI